MLLVAGVIFTLFVGAKGQLNPLGRFGKCIKVPTVGDSYVEGIWYIQARPENPDHYVHTCQAQYEKTLCTENENFLHSLLYFYNKGKSVNEPQNIKYRPDGEGIYLRKITCDKKTVVIKTNVLFFDLEKKYRLLYLCADCDEANPDIFNVQIATLNEQCPENIEEVLKEGKAKLKEVCDKFDMPLMKVEQSLEKCEPLSVTKSAKNPFICGKENIE